MNKYNETWYKNELKYRTKRDLFLKKQSLKLYKYIYFKYGIKDVLNLFNEYGFNLAIEAIFDITFEDKELKILN